MNNRSSVGERADRGARKRELMLAQRDKLNEQVRENIPTLDAILPSHMNAAQFAAIVSGLVARNDELAIAAVANPVSFIAAIADAARLGLVPGDGYALIPFGVENPGAKTEVVGTPEYTGEIELIYRTNIVESVIAEVVFEHDHYMPGRRTHEAPEFSRGPTEFATDAERGKPIGAFCYCVLKNGNVSRVVRMNRDEIMKHRDIARSKKLWDGDFWRSAWLKTVIHEQFKWVEKSPEYRASLNASAAALGASPLGELTPGSPVELAADVPSLRVRAIGIGNGEPERRQGRPPLPADAVRMLFDRIGCTNAGEQLRVVQRVVPEYVAGTTLTEEQAGLLIVKLNEFIDEADGPDHTPYDGLRDWLDAGEPTVEDPPSAGDDSGEDRA